MNYRELVQEAAKAAGYGIARWSDDGKGLLLTGVQEPWNPWDDDGDAFRLAVRRGLFGAPFAALEFVAAMGEATEEERLAATRHAIVEMAVASMPTK